MLQLHITVVITVCFKMIGTQSQKCLQMIEMFHFISLINKLLGICLNTSIFSEKQICSSKKIRKEYERNNSNLTSRQYEITTVNLISILLPECMELALTAIGS